MNSSEIRKKFIDFFKKQGHLEIQGSPMVSDDPTILFVNAGMVQFKPYFLGLKPSPSKRITNFQKCFRMVDIDKVGDSNRTLTFFEMLGNWSIGDYGREKAIAFAWELLTEIYKIDKEKLWVSVFRGEDEIFPDDEALKIWLALGLKKERIIKLGLEDNFWLGGPVGPCGRCSEIYYDLGKNFGCGRKNCQPGCDCDRFVEIWNLVFIEYCKNEDGGLTDLPIKSIDTGAGLERLAMVLQQKSSVFETDLFLPIIEKIPGDNNSAKRIIVDHIKAAVFLISEGVLPSNIERGYVLRRLIRRAIRYGKLINLPKQGLHEINNFVVAIYKDIYPILEEKQADIFSTLQNEGEKFEKSLQKGLKEFETQIEKSRAKTLSGKIVFDLYQSYGFPLELTKELAKEQSFEIDEKSFEQELKKHQDISRAGAKKKFGGIGKETDIKAIKFHTATHLLQAALRKILGVHIKQMGSDITSERLRFDFFHSEQLLPKQTKEIEDLVNQKIKAGLEVKKQEMKYEKAIESGALAFFKGKYPEIVNVYSINDFSKEVCAGPHIKNTQELGLFKVIKIESIGENTKRIRAILE